MKAFRGLGHNCVTKGEGFKNCPNLRDVIYECSLTAIIIKWGLHYYAHLISGTIWMVDKSKSGNQMSIVQMDVRNSNGGLKTGYLNSEQFFGIQMIATASWVIFPLKIQTFCLIFGWPNKKIGFQLIGPFEWWTAICWVFILIGISGGVWWKRLFLIHFYHPRT